MKLELNKSELMLIKEALTDLQSQLVGVGTKTNTIVDILNKVSDSDKPKLKKVILNKEYMFTFEEGGWNTVWAKTKKGAIKAALKEYKSSDGLTVRVGSVHKSTPSGLTASVNIL